MNIVDYVKIIYEVIPSLKDYQYPWQITDDVENILFKLIKTLGDDYEIKENVAIHKSAQVSERALIKGPAIIGRNCFISVNAYLRGGVFLDQDITIGGSCEIKSSFIFRNSAIAHLNYVGNSIIGSNVNLEAGSIVANHFNEREDKEITAVIDGKQVKTGVSKFGALVGDNTKIGANAVLSPGTILMPESVVNRLELVKQDSLL